MALYHRARCKIARHADENVCRKETEANEYLEACSSVVSLEFTRIQVLMASAEHTLHCMQEQLRATIGNGYGRMSLPERQTALLDYQ
jgi:hypothetical protein